MNDLTLKIATMPYDRIEPLRNRTVRPKGIDLDYTVDMPGHNIFLRMIEDREFDVSEMSYALHSVQRTRGDFPYIGIPLFMHRLFAHSHFYVHRRSGIESPKDLEGKRIGIQEYRQSTLVWNRGTLRDEFGVDTTSIQWVEGGINSYRRPRESDVKPEGGSISIEILEGHESCSEALLDGALDALITAREPSCFDSSDDVVRLFPDFKSAEQESYRKLRLFPVMHIIAMREELHEEQPWVAQSLFDAFVEAQAVAWKRLMFTAPVVPVPWLALAVQESNELFGGNPYTYGIENNRLPLETFQRYLVEDQLLPTAPSLESLFVTVDESAAIRDNEAYYF